MRKIRISIIPLIGILLILGACGNAASITPPAKTQGTGPAAFTTSGLTVTPKTAKPGEPVEVGVMVTNTGGEQGTYTVVVKLHDGTVVGTKEVTLAGGAKENVTLHVTINSTGTHMIMIDKLAANLVVQDAVAPTPTQPASTQPVPTRGTGPAAFVLSDFKITPEMQEPGGKVLVNVKVTNTGGEAGTYPLVLKIENDKTKKQDTETKNVTLAGGASQAVTFTISLTVEGTYTVMIDKLQGSLMIDEHAMM